MPNNNTDFSEAGLSGLWVVIPDGDDGYSLAGQITRSLGGHHLIKMNGPMPSSRLMTSDALRTDETHSSLIAKRSYRPG
jgi:hypothetical protein